MDNGNHSVFISYATPDRDRVQPYFDWLKQNGLVPWMDCHSIRPGQNWDFEIKRALEKSSVIVAFVSENSFNRRGYVQRELKFALDKLSEKLIDDIYIVPVLLDDGIDIPEQLRSIHCIAASDIHCKEKVCEALFYQLGRLGTEIKRIQQVEDLYWKSTVIKEMWDGMPGYEFELQLLSFSSRKYANVAEIDAYIKGQFMEDLFRHRTDKLLQQPNFYNYGQDRFRRTNTFDAHCGDPCIQGRVVTIQYTIDWYGAGAAHSNTSFRTFSFVLEPLTKINSLKEVFSESDEVFPLIQDAVRHQLYALGTQEADNAEPLLDKSWVNEGTSTWNDFSAFVFCDGKVRLLFAPYQVGAYAFGAQFADIECTKVAKYMRPEFLSALGLEYLDC